MIRRVSVAAAALLIVGLLAPSGASARTVQPRPFQTSKSPDLAFVANDALYRAFRGGRISEADYALERAHSLFSLGEVRDRYGRVARVPSRAATYVLRDLALRMRDLSGSDRTAAEAILARPSEPDDEFSYGAETDMSTCSTSFCVHWASGGVHAPDLTDNSANGIPDWVDSVFVEYEYVVGSFATDLGYQPVKSDLSSEENGGNALPDVYLADIGDAGLYGYCTTDDPNTENNAYTGFDFSAYCVIDDDFTASQFPFQTPIDNMRVTAAHEFFHAVQFGYDAADDIWFLESTAAWVEDVLYDDINDNYQYLKQSAITYPDAPIDLIHEELPILRYGGWLFFRFLTEYAGDGVTPDIDIVRKMWERAAARQGSPSDPDDYSILAVKNVLEAQGIDFAEAFGDFGSFNWVVELFYEEGVDYFNFLAANGESPRPFVIKTHRISKSKPKTGIWDLASGSDHLTTNNVVFKPKKGVKRNAKLVIKVDGPKAVSSPEFRYIVFKKSGLPGIFNFPIDSEGVGKKKVPFGKGTVTSVVLVMTNASTRFTSCYSGSTSFSCGGGVAIDDGAELAWSGKLKQ